jgi:hypothetical protein
MSGNAAFNSVAANNLNVTGILQASQINTTQPMAVTNITAAGSLGVTGASTLAGVSASGALAVAGQSSLTNVTASGTLGVTGASTLGVVSAKNASVSVNLSVAQVSSLTDVNMSGNLDVVGSTNIETPSITNPIVYGDLMVSGNVFVGGNVFTGFASSTASVLNTAGLIPYGTPTPDAYDVFQLPTRLATDFQTGEATLTVSDIDTNIDFKIKDETGKVILNGTNTTDSKSYLAYFPTANVFAPTWVRMSDTANVQIALANLYANVPSTYQMTTHYNSVGVLPNSFSPSDVDGGVPKILSYTIDRGFGVTPVDYIEPKFKHCFVGSRFFDADVFIEFGYDVSTTVPSNVYLAFNNHTIKFTNGGYTFFTQSNTFGGNFLLTDYATAQTNANIYQQHMVIPVTTDPAAFGAAYGSPNAKLALWDPTQNHVHFYFKGSSNTVSTGATNAAFNSNTASSGLAWDEVIEMSSFSGSFAVVKKRNLVTPTTRPFTIASTGDPDSFLMQISNTFTSTSNAYKSGVEIPVSAGYNMGSRTQTRRLYNSSSQYTGKTLSKPGFGKNSYDVACYYLSDANAVKVDSPAVSLGVNTSSFLTPYSVPNSVVLWNNPNHVPRIKSMPGYSGFYTDTPEQANVNLTSSLILSNAAVASTFLMIHEYYHALTNTPFTYNTTELHAVTTEIDAMKRLGINACFLARSQAFSALLRVFSTGSGPLGLGYPLTPGSIHLAGSGVANIPNGHVSTSYAQGFFMSQIQTRYDTNNQLDIVADYMYTERLYQCVSKCGAPSVMIKDLSPKLWQLSYDDALQSLTATQGSRVTLSNAFVDAFITSTIMRNNASIPSKYRASYPFWLWNRRASYFEALKAGTPASLYASVVWSDNEENRPSVYNSSGLSRGLFNIEDDTPISIWPKTGSVFSEGIVKNALGSWNSRTTPTTFTYTSNTYINTPLSHTIEDLTTVSYVMPIAAAYGTTDRVSNVSITVGRGDWVIKVVQFIPNGGDGTFIESRNAIEYNIPGVYDPVADTWSDNASPVTLDINFTGILTSTTASGSTTDTTGFVTNCAGPNYGDGCTVRYFPRLLCINRGNYRGYNADRVVYGTKPLYTGHITLQATVV